MKEIEVKISKQLSPGKFLFSKGLKKSYLSAAGDWLEIYETNTESA